MKGRVGFFFDIPPYAASWSWEGELKSWEGELNENSEKEAKRLLFVKLCCWVEPKKIILILKHVGLSAINSCQLLEMSAYSTG